MTERLDRIEAVLAGIAESQQRSASRYPTKFTMIGFQLASRFSMMEAEPVA